MQLIPFPPLYALYLASVLVMGTASCTTNISSENSPQAPSGFPDAGTGFPSFADSGPSTSTLQVQVDSVLNGKTYEVFELVGQEEQERYSDRNYRLKDLPDQLQGAFFIQTANDDKDFSSDVFLELSLTAPATVYVAHDNRIGDKPAWLANFDKTDLSIRDTDDDSGKFALFSADVSAGRVSLGGNMLDGGDGGSMYSVFIVGG